MNASLDTDIVIHLYLSGKQGIVFSFFDKLYMHEYLYENELKNKSVTVYEAVTKDVEVERIKIISTKDLIDMGIKGLFEKYKRDFKYLFDSGELYAVSMAKAMGLVAFVSDDTKEYGPHETLVKELIEDVIPFAFYELLFLRYVSSSISLQEMQIEFVEVTTVSMHRHPMNFKKRMLLTVRRFSRKHGTVRDFDWIYEFCEQREIDYNQKMTRLQEFLHNIE